MVISAESRLKNIFFKLSVKKLIFFSLFICLLALSNPLHALAADYQFSIPKDLVIFWVEKDGTVSISYEFSIKNSGQGLDFIDIGLPNNNFPLSGVTATIDGDPVPQNLISYVDTGETGIASGITIDNRSNPIPAGSQAEIYIEVQQMRDILYQASEPQNGVDYVSFKFQPNYFSSDFTRGTTDLTIRLVLPAGMTNSDPVYFPPEDWHGMPDPDSWITKTGEVVYEWQSSNANSYSPYIFGAMFPQSLLNANVSISKEPQQNQFISKASDALCSSGFLVPIIASIILFVAVISGNKKKIKTGSYLPPSIKAEGEGIKRGLTAVEAAVLLEEKMDKVISMIVFSLVKKNVIRVTNQNPLKIEVEGDLPADLYDYETGFIEAMELDKDSKKKVKMEKVITGLINSVAEKMKGFSLEETKFYYKSIISKAWEQVKQADSPELKGEKLDEIFGWAMLDDDIEKQTEESFGGGPVFLPTWWWRMNPTYGYPSTGRGPSTIPAGTPSPSIPTPTSMPTLPGADFARSITDSVRNFSEGTVGNLRDFTQSVKGVTNPAPVHSSSSGRRGGSGRSGGSSCACACACAGCACACAGGGGGR